MSNTMNETAPTADMTIGGKGWRAISGGTFESRAKSVALMTSEQNRRGNACPQLRVVQDGRRWVVEEYRSIQKHSCGREVGLGHYYCWFCHCG